MEKNEASHPLNTRSAGIRLFPTVLCFCLLLTPFPGAAWSRMSPDLQELIQNRSQEEPVAVIVVFADSADFRLAPPEGNRARRRAAMIRSLRSAAEKNQQNLRPFLRSRGVKKMRSLWLINGMAVSVSPEVLRRMADMPGVAEVRRDRRYDKDELLMQAAAPPERNLSQVGAPTLWNLDQFGQGITIGLMDTGADVLHPDLAATWRGGANGWLDPYGQHGSPVDTDEAGHGTAVLGIMAGGDAGGTSIGVAPKTRWIAARLFNDQGWATNSAIHEIFQWFLDPDGNPATDDAPDVINGSWGLVDRVGQAGTCYPEFQPDITALNAAGIATVFAAGNYGPEAATSISPADYTGAIAVGAVNGTDTLFELGSRGPSACDGRIYPDVVAPGVDIRTASRSFGGFLNYTVGTGTSFSAPHVSGALALLKAAFPAATLEDLKTALFASAMDLGPAGPDNDFGYGRIRVDDAQGAYAYLRDSLGLAECVRPEVHLSSSPYPGSVGRPVTFTATVNGGGGSYIYTWDVNGDGEPEYTTDTSDNSIQHIYTAPYAGSVGLRVADVSDSLCASELVVADQWACSTVTALVRVQPNPGYVGEPVVFRSTVSGGVPPYTYAWDIDSDGSIDCATSTCTKTFTAVFEGAASVVVTDSLGCSSASSPTSYSIQPLSSQNVGPAGGDGGGCFIETIFEGGRSSWGWP